MLVGIAALAATTRVWKRSPAGVAGGRLEGLVLVAVGLTIAGGLGLLLGGARPREPLHFLYAVIAMGALPSATSVAGRLEPRRRAVAALLGALVALVAILRLFATG